ncbi:MAG: prepilin peptidase [Planctomycetes bacterium]|nr:prepilin peptidase [Planctomycetota bacterium]
MTTFILIFAFLFGLVFGSFFNVLIYRLPLGKSIIKPGSACPNCGNPIKWYHNIPVLSYIILGGRCAHCRVRISLRYPLVELLTGALFALTVGVYSADIARLTITLYLVSILLVVTFIDFAHRIIPDEISISGMILAPIVSTIFPSIHTEMLFAIRPAEAGQFAFINGLLACLVGMLVGGGVVYLVGLIGKAVFRKEAMGFGDVKLMALLGGFMGWQSILFVFFLGCIFGSVIGIIFWIVTKDRYIAFGPFLAMGALVMLFLKPQIIQFTFYTYPEFLRGLLLY